MPSVKKRPIQYYKQLKKIIQENNYKIIHINMLSLANILPILAAKKAKAKKIIIHSHNGDVPKSILKKFLNTFNRAFALKLATDFWACSQLAGEWMFKQKEFTIINNAIDVEKFEYNEKKRDEIRKKMKLEDKLVIGHVGRFCEQKNHEFLLQIVEEVFKERKNAVLLSIGEGELKENIIQTAKIKKIEDKIIFLDPVNNVNEYLQAMDIFVLPSKFEGLPVTAVEAQCTGIKCIFSNNITKEAKIVDNCYFVDLEVKQWKDKILEEDCYNRAEQSKIVKQSKFNIKNNVEILSNLYCN